MFKWHFPPNPSQIIYQNINFSSKKNLSKFQKKMSQESNFVPNQFVSTYSAHLHSKCLKCIEFKNNVKASFSPIFTKKLTQHLQINHQLFYQSYSYPNKSPNPMAMKPITRTTVIYSSQKQLQISRSQIHDKAFMAQRRYEMCYI